MRKAGFYLDEGPNGVAQVGFLTEEAAIESRWCTTARTEIVEDGDAWILRPVRYHIRTFSR